MAEEDEFAEIWKAIAPHLTEGGRFNFVDGSHASPVPRKIFSSEALFKLVSAYGKPVYVIESTGANQLYKLLNEYKKFSPEERNKTRDFYINTDIYPGFSNALFNVMDRVAQGKAHVVFPDTRNINSEFKLKNNEARAFINILGIVNKVGGDCADETQNVVEKSSTPAARKALDSALEKINRLVTGGAPTTELIDAKISANVDRLKKRDNIPKNSFEIMIYGALHYLKEKDLNEHRKGLTLAVFESPEASKLNREKKNKDGKPIYSDTPDFVWYSNEKRLVKLDTPEAKREFWHGNIVEKDRIAACYDKLREIPSLRDAVDRLRAEQNNPNAKPNSRTAPAADRPGLGRH